MKDSAEGMRTVDQQSPEEPGMKFPEFTLHYDLPENAVDEMGETLRIDSEARGRYMKDGKIRIGDYLRYHTVRPLGSDRAVHCKRGTREKTEGVYWLLR